MLKESKGLYQSKDGKKLWAQTTVGIQKAYLIQIVKVFLYLVIKYTLY